MESALKGDATVSMPTKKRPITCSASRLVAGFDTHLSSFRVKMTHALITHFCRKLLITAPVKEAKCLLLHNYITDVESALKGDAPVSIPTKTRPITCCHTLLSLPLLAADFYTHLSSFPIKMPLGHSIASLCRKLLITYQVKEGRCSLSADKLF